MLSTDEQRKVFVAGLKNYLGCEVVRTNTTAEMPNFPYLGYNITTLASENRGTYGVYKDGWFRKAVTQTASFTAHADNFSEAAALANKAREWLDCVGTQYLNDNDVIVESVGSVTDRSNLLTSDYDYAYGFDCFLTMFDEISPTVDTGGGEIETIQITESTQN